MISSMTGFARETINTDSGTLSIEIRTINHRYLEMYFKLPEILRTFEPHFRELIQNNLGRGKVEIMMRFETAANHNEELVFNEEMAKNIINLYRKANELLCSSHTLSPTDLLRFPNVITASVPDVEKLKNITMATLQSALKSLTENRQAEGKRINNVIKDRLIKIKELTIKAEELRPNTAQKLRDKLNQRLEELQIDVDKSRLEQELVFAIQKLDINEEIDRLLSHVKAMEEAIERKEPIGRRLDFLTQEFNREANTLGSKSQDAELTAIAVELKVLIEQIREQIQNIE